MRRAKKLKLICARPNTSDISSHFNRNLPTSTVDHSLITCFRVGLASLFGVESVRARLEIRQEGESRWAALVSGCASHPGNQGSILTFFVMKGSACHISKKKIRQEETLLTKQVTSPVVRRMCSFQLYLNIATCVLLFTTSCY
jgi:hypothetical protein